MQTLAAKPQDPEASLAVGRFQCFRKGDWDKGLPLLAAGSDMALAGLAKKELAKPKDAKTQAEVGEGWWEQAGKETGPLRARLRERSRPWLRQALPGLSGLDKVPVEDKLKLVIGKLELRPGLVGEYFQGTNFERKLKTRMEYRVDFNWGFGSPDPTIASTDFSCRWQGWLVPPRAGVYTLITHSDDGARLTVDGKVLIDKFNASRAAGRQAVTVRLTDKPHLLVVEHSQGIGSAAMSFQWSAEGGFAEQPVPMEALYHDLKQEKALSN